MVVEKERRINMPPKGFEITNMYIIDTETGEKTELNNISDIEIESDCSDQLSEKFLFNHGSFSATIENCQIDGEFLNIMERQYKKYLRDKAQYKFYKDQGFIFNNHKRRKNYWSER